MTIVPRATYRLQLRGGFGFNEAAAIAPYLTRLGVSHAISRHSSRLALAARMATT